MININDYILEKLYIGKGYTSTPKPKKLEPVEFSEYINTHGGVESHSTIYCKASADKNELYPNIKIYFMVDGFAFVVIKGINDRETLIPVCVEKNKYKTFKPKKVGLKLENESSETVFAYTDQNADILIRLLDENYK